MTLEQGIHPDVPAAVYHADPAPAPSLSAHDAATIIGRTAAHVRAEHPRLNPDLAPSESSGEQDEGTALHSLLLERVENVEVVDAPDWRTKAAQEARKAAREAGRVPILAARWDDLRRCAEAFDRQIEEHDFGDFLTRPGRAEATIIWQDESDGGDLWCRARADWLCDDGSGVIVDLKTTGAAANPDAWFRSSKDAGLRAVHYLRGARAVGFHKRPRYLFALLERQPPFALSICELSPAILDMAEEQHRAARSVFAACLRDGEWPAFPPFVATIEASSGAVYAHEDWRNRQQQVRERRPKPFAGQASERIAATIRNGGEPFA